LTTHNAAFGHEAHRVITLEDGRIVKEEIFGNHGVANVSRAENRHAGEALAFNR
jgi:hypothetical protein